MPTANLHGAVLEQYNHYRTGSRHHVQGWLVALYDDGLRVSTLAWYGEQEQAARSLVAASPDGIGAVTGKQIRRATRATRPIWRSSTGAQMSADKAT